jgi:hypothetical protein
MRSKALSRFQFENNDSAFIKADFFTKGGVKKSNFIKDNPYGITFDQVRVRPIEGTTTSGGTIPITVFQTKSFYYKKLKKTESVTGNNPRAGKELKTIYNKHNNLVIPNHYLIPIVPGAKKDLP